MPIWKHTLCHLLAIYQWESCHHPTWKSRVCEKLRMPSPGPQGVMWGSQVPWEDPLPQRVTQKVIRGSCWISLSFISTFKLAWILLMIITKCWYVWRISILQIADLDSFHTRVALWNSAHSVRITCLLREILAKKKKTSLWIHTQIHTRSCRCRRDETLKSWVEHMRAKPWVVGPQEAPLGQPLARGLCSPSGAFVWCCIYGITLLPSTAGLLLPPFVFR